MAQVTRRGFLLKTTAGAATVGALMTVPGLGDISDVSAAPSTKFSPAELSGLVVAHVRNARTGEIALMVGAREIVIHDRKLVARLLRAAR